MLKSAEIKGVRETVTETERGMEGEEGENLKEDARGRESERAIERECESKRDQARLCESARVRGGRGERRRQRKKQRDRERERERERDRARERERLDRGRKELQREERGHRRPVGPEPLWDSDDTAPLKLAPLTATAEFRVQV
jgi:hypothetical protein